MISVCGPDVRWCGNEAGHTRTQEWSVVPVELQDLEKITERSQQIDDGIFSRKITSGDEDLGSQKALEHYHGELVWYPAEVNTSIRPGWFYHESQDKKVKTPEYLKEIYFHSVGRNGVLLLNIPPDKRGLITDFDLAALKNWRKKLDEIFRVNLLKGAKGVGAFKKINVLTDGNDATHHLFSMKGNDNAVEMDLKEAKTFNVLLLQENIRVGQRVEKFILEYWDNNQWKKASEGTTIGYKRLLEFPSITASKVRLRIISSRLQPTLAEMGLYFDKSDKK